MVKQLPIGCPETSLKNYHPTLREISQERRSQAKRSSATLVNVYQITMASHIIAEWRILAVFFSRIRLLLCQPYEMYLLEVCHPPCVCENWRGYVIKQLCQLRCFNDYTRQLHVSNSTGHLQVVFKRT